MGGFTAHAETEDFDEAVTTARRVLTAHLAALIASGGALPRARSLAELRATPELAEDFAEADTTVMLPALMPFGRTKRVNLSIDENTLELIGKAASIRGLIRSAFVAEAARQYAS